MLLLSPFFFARYKATMRLHAATSFSAMKTNKTRFSLRAMQLPQLSIDRQALTASFSFATMESRSERVAELQLASSSSTAKMTAARHSHCCCWPDGGGS